MDGKTQISNAGVKGWSRRDAVLVAIAVIALVAAAATTLMYATSRVPDDAAAKVNNDYLYEQELASYIQQYRFNGGLADDADFAKALLDSSYNVGTFRQSCINQLALNMLIDERAEELGLSPAAEDVEALYAQTKSDYAMESDDIWEATLADQGMTEEGVRAQLSTRLAQQAVFEADVARPKASDAQILSYIAQVKPGQTMRHSYRILFTGQDQWDRAQECYEQMKTLDDMSVEAFAAFAMQYSDDEGVETSGGAYGWDDAKDMAEDYRDVLAGLAEGQYSEPASIDSEDAAVIVFCDELFEFPEGDAAGEVKKKDVPQDLWDYLAEEAADGLWATECNAYLANLLSNAKITYYPIPDGASYDVDMSLAMQGDE